MNPSQAGTSNSTLPPAGSVGLHMRSTSRVANDNIANVLAMAETVREVLPHIPGELIFQDLQRTNSVTVTVNNLLPRPGFPLYEARAAFSHLEVRHYDLLPKKGWEVDLDAVEALANENTVAMAIINPGNPCGNVFTYQHLKKVAETARKLGRWFSSNPI
ncbi:hypothetical protein CsSME_00034855 [Camellia sinensis var. sinensis]|uniref:S-alkyl-thiohydroximate lyase SUR1-like n=1 Tax=Camellia sinensis TaxID=4442 RepID=UPI001036DAF7|nr:S-alkyl-thiohydroximate lyase SUR1-like [Camellia sinensis]